MTVENRPGFTPKLRPGEQMPVPPEGKDVTRVDGKLVFVSAKSPDESYVGKSAYTKQQLQEIVAIKRENNDANNYRNVNRTPRFYLGLYLD